MSREIKFKYIWSNPEKTNFITQIFTLDEIEAGNQFMVLENEPLLKDYKLIARVQFTGLLDKNGKEVFKNDIISTPHFFNWTITGYEKRKVFFKDGAFGVKENEHGFIALKSLFKGVESSKTYISNYGEVYREFEPVFEVIGNIFQNPELLGGENE